MCSVFYLTLKDKLFCTSYKIINVGAENTSCKVSNHMPESSSQATECNSVVARGNGVALQVPWYTLLFHHRNATACRLGHDPKNRTDSSLWRCLKSEQESSLTPKQQKVPDYRKMMLYHKRGVVRQCPV